MRRIAFSSPLFSAFIAIAGLVLAVGCGGPNATNEGSPKLKRVAAETIALVATQECDAKKFDSCPGSEEPEFISLVAGDDDSDLAPALPQAIEFDSPGELPKEVNASPIKQAAPSSPGKFDYFAPQSESPIETETTEIAGDAKTESPESKDAEPSDDAAAPAAKAPAAKKEAPLPLTPELLRLRFKIRETLAWHFERPQRMTDRSPWGAMHAMLPYGVDSTFIDTNGRRQNAVGYLCFNFSCRGQRLFHLEQGKIAAHIGPGYQGHRGQFLAMLAQSKVASTYPMRIENKAFTVEDLIQYEKDTCEAGTELTFKLIAFAHYLPHDASWKNTKGEDWDIPRLIREELAQPVVGAACGGTHRMTGFSYAVRKHEARGGEMTGQWLRASKFIDTYHDYAFTLQNRDGGFSTEWFARRGDAADPQRKIQTTGHIVEWLVYSLPQSRLNDPRLVRGVEFIADTLNEGRNTKWEIGPLGHALHALALYDERVFAGQPGKRAEQLSRENRRRDAMQR